MDFALKKAEEIIKRFGTSDVFKIANRNEVSIVYESWFPVTIGEFERKTRTIKVNLQALQDEKTAKKLEKQIIAHELGHFFALDLKLNKKEEENFAHAFAESLMRNNG